MNLMAPRPAEQRCDISTADEVDTFVRRFYGAIAQDDLLGPLFNDVAQVDWAAHIPKLIAFWCRALFGTQGYQGNPFAKHKAVHEISSFTLEHFDHWISIFEDTLDDGWSGEYVESMKVLARNVARVHSTQLLGTPCST